MLMTILLISVIVIGYYYRKKSNIIPNYGFTDEEIQEYGPFWITVPAAENEGLQSDINGVMFENDLSTIYLIFPSNVDCKKIVYYVRDGYVGNYIARREGDFSIDGEVYIAGKTISIIMTDIPIMYITTNDAYISFEDLKKAVSKDTYCYGDMTLIRTSNKIITEHFKSYENDESCPSTMFLQPRGNNYGLEKKYAFTMGLEKKANLLNMGNNKRWNLLADYRDRSLLKNYAFNILSKHVGIYYQPNMEHIVLFINRDFQGIYLLTTKVSVNKERVDLSKNDYFINWGGSHPEQPVTYKSNCWYGDIVENDNPYVELCYPENANDIIINDVRKIVQRVQDAIENENDNNLAEYLDMESMARYYWVQEISMNFDACYRSTYSYYKQNEHKLYFGPIWDMDITLGHTTELDGVSFLEPYGWKIRKLAYYKELFEHDDFAKIVNSVYFDGGIREEMFSLVDEMENEKNRIFEIADLNYKLWYSESDEVESYSEYTDDVIDIYKKRINWIDTQMQKTK